MKILSERNYEGELTSAEDCPVNMKCDMHSNAARWLSVGDLDALLAQLDIFYVLRRRVWRDCTCDMFRRIQRALGMKR